MPPEMAILPAQPSPAHPSPKATLVTRCLFFNVMVTVSALDPVLKGNSHCPHLPGACSLESEMSVKSDIYRTS